jgi:glycosyltransferase involved in cell wall biosynthesis
MIKYTALRTELNALNITHLLGFPLGINGPLHRALNEAIYVTNHGANVNFCVSIETIRKKVLQKSIPNQYKNRLRIYPLKPLLPSGQVGWRVNNLLPFLLQTYQFMNLHKEDVIHIHAPSPVSRPFSACLLSKTLKCSTVLDLHDPWSGHPFSKSPLMLLQTQIMRYVIKNVDLVITPHRPLFNLIRAMDKRKQIYLIPNGIDSEIFSPQPKNEDLMNKLNFTFEDLIVGFSGQITEEKGLDTLVYAAKLLTKNNKKIKFLIIGDGPDRKKIESLVKRHGLQKFFRFVGFLSIENLVQYCSLADICVCPYKPMAHYNVMKIETPMKVVQYLSMGKPVIMSRVSDENVVSWSDGGFLIDPANPHKLAESINTLAQDKKLRYRMGKKGRSYVESNLGWNLIAEKLLKVYNTL